MSRGPPRQQQQQPGEADELHEAFYYFDQDKDGYLSIQELRHVLSHIGKMKDEDVDEMLWEADPNQTGKVSYGEFTQRLMAVINQFGG